MITPDYAGLADELDAHMGKQEVPILLRDCRRAAAAIRTLLESNAALGRERELWEETARLSEQRVRVWQERAETAEAERDRLAKIVGKVLTWAEQRCPCHNEEPNPCPLCGASVENLEACKSAENTIPASLLADLRTARSLVRGGGDE